MAADLHELSHDATHVHIGHDAADEQHEDIPGGLHAALHGVHVCGHGIAIPPSVMPLVLSGERESLLPHSDDLPASAASSLLFRPPRQS